MSKDSFEESKAKFSKNRQGAVMLMNRGSNREARRSKNKVFTVTPMYVISLMASGFTGRKVKY